MRQYRPAGIRGAITVLVAAGLAAAILVRFGVGARGVIEAFVVAVLVWISAIDLERRLIPNVIVLPSFGLVLAAQIAAFPGHTVEWVLSALAAAGLLLLLVIVYPAGMGMGDVKLGLLLGAALGRLVGAALLLGFVAAALFGLALIILRGAQARKQAIAFGPFLALGAIVTLFLAAPGQS